MSRVIDAVQRRAYRAWFGVIDPGAYLKHPIFIIGCGRSGTTALADVLGQHPDVANVNEARHIWRLLPEADLWDYDGLGWGRLVLTAKDASPAERARLRQGFAAESAVLGGKRFVEKLPENAFRVNLLDVLFPDALFIHLLRDGREVADSIRRRYESDGRWYGRDGYKWNLLASHADVAGYGDLLRLCTDTTSKGLLEWRLAVEAARRARALVGEERWIEVRYEDLVNNTGAVIKRVLRWAGLDHDPATIVYAEAHLKRQKPAITNQKLTEIEEKIAGDLLEEFQFAK